MTLPASSASSVPGRVGAATPPRGVHGAVFALLLLATLFAYGPSLSGDFLWDDAGHVTNPALQSWPGLARIWTEPGVTQQYYPLLHSAFWLEHRLWGDAPLGYRLINVVWHTLSAWLLIALLRRFAVPGALLAGCLFALHPVAVESVAWIAEQKNTLSTVFYLLAALAWLRFEEERSQARYAVATIWFLAALLTKSVTGTLPAALLVVGWWRRGRLSWRGDGVPLLPWFGLAAAAGLMTAWFERTGIGAQGADFGLGAAGRVLVAGRACWFYLGKLLWPADLAFFYPRWSIDPSSAPQYGWPAAALLLVGALAWVAVVRGRRGPLAAILLFGGTLFPALGFIDVYPFLFSFVADHFQYLSSLGMLAFLAAAGATAVREGWLGIPRRVALTLAGALVVLLGVLTRVQSGAYVDSTVLYRASLARNPDSWIAHTNLASELTARGELDDALGHARRAVDLKPDSADALNNLADVLTRTGRALEALPWAEKAATLRPLHAPAQNTWGITLAALARREEAAARFERAIALQPSLVEAHYNLGLVRAERGDFAGAAACFAQTVFLSPEHGGAELNWGVALALTGRLAEARPHLSRAAELDPDSAAVRRTCGRVLLQAGELDDALVHLREAARLDPDLPGLQDELAGLRRRLGRSR